MELDRGHIDRYGLIGLDVLDLVGTGGGIQGQLLAVRIHAFDDVAGARLHGEGHSAVIVHGRELVVGRGRQISERRVEACARREGDIEGLDGHSADSNRQCQSAGCWVRISQILFHSKLVIKRDNWFSGNRISAFNTLYRHQHPIG